MAATIIVEPSFGIDELIDLVRSKPQLYNPQHEDYKNTLARENTWVEISQKLSISTDLAKKKWKNLRDTFMKVRTKSKEGRNGGTAATQIKWPHFDHLKFLNDTLPEKRPYTSSVQSSAVENQQEREVSTDDESTRVTDPTSSQGGPPLKKARQADAVDREILNVIQSLAQAEDDDVNDAFGKTIALELKCLPKEKQARARFGITELLFSFHEECD